MLRDYNFQTKQHYKEDSIVATYSKRYKNFNGIYEVDDRLILARLKLAIFFKQEDIHLNKPDNIESQYL